MMITKTKARIVLALLLALPMAARATADMVIGADAVSRFYVADANQSKLPKEFVMMQVIDGNQYVDLDTFGIFADIEFDEADSDGEDEFTARASVGKKVG